MTYNKCLSTSFETLQSACNCRRGEFPFPWGCPTLRAQGHEQTVCARLFAIFKNEHMRTQCCSRVQINRQLSASCMGLFSLSIGVQSGFLWHDFLSLACLASRERKTALTLRHCKRPPSIKRQGVVSPFIEARSSLDRIYVSVRTTSAAPRRTRQRGRG
ncbi:hypothetical protein BD289DRAFT_443682 [Coniella lustricola]|uniref:Uncharacterized protein n=1 Tax=Coniella lustricola TaxID=2025994 RepID=A0A2T2ZWP0_9PEZI|nr:hypothetical protein BD289DRAFT_443682 [Coniella lustricola]